GATGVINLSGGLIVTGDHGGLHIGDSAPGTYEVGGIEYTQAGDGTVNQSRGTPHKGREIHLGKGTEGDYNLSGGDLWAGYNGNGQTRIGMAGNGTFNQTGGNYTNTTPVWIGTEAGQGLMQISDGTFTGTNVIVGGSSNAGSGTLRVIGSDST